MKIAILTKPRQLRTLLALFCLFTFSSDGFSNNENLEALREIEASVTSVAAKASPATVAISDGIGFGSGVIVSADGLILTAGHVINSGSAGQEFQIIFPSGRTAIARSLGKNLNVDAGMLKLVEPGPWPHVSVARHDSMLGDWVVCLGHSGGYELGRKPPVRTGKALEKRGEQLVTDAVLIGGDSGGPLLNLDGELVGIHSSIGDTVAENRHVLISIFRRDWDRMERGESWGQLPELTSRKRNQDKTAPENQTAKKSAKLGVVVDRTMTQATVKSVRDGSPAQRVGIESGDVITTFDGHQVTGPQHLIDLVKTKNVGDTVSLSVTRGTYHLNFQIILDQLN